MSGLPYGVLAGGAPFPGLRSFEAEESLLFFGREAHIDELLERLGDNRFVAVTGTSGSGKSSLVRAGLRPALHRGYLVDATSRWRFATLRPGTAPIDALAGALMEGLGLESLDDVRRPLCATSAGVSQVVSRAGLARGESLLIVVDQFEELFRFEVTRDEDANAALFVSLILAAAQQRDVPIYVVATMRSEFLGRCSEFTGLVEAFNRSQYLVPRLTRDQRREAVERPLKLFGIAATPALVQQVLNDAGDDPDQLPVMQHVLVRSFREWERSGATGPLDLRHYEAVGGIERALDRHGDEILSGMTDQERAVSEKLFRSLTVGQGGVALRRPRRMRQLYTIAGATGLDAQRQIDHIVTTFAHRDNSFLMLSSATLTPETVADITHESLIRKWKRLERWVRAETRSGEWYADLSRDVVRYRTAEVSTWQDPELSGVLRRRDEDGWNDAWANQYRREGDPAFSEVTGFLDESTRQQTERRREAALQKEAATRARRRSIAVRAALFLGVVAVSILAYRLVIVAQREAATRQLYEELSQQGQKSQADVEALRAQLAAASKPTPASASPEDKARQAQQVEQLAQKLALAAAKSSESEAALAKLRKDQELSNSDRGGLLKRIETLQQQLTQSNTERDALQIRVDVTQKQSAQPSDDRQTLQRQLDDERSRSASAAEIVKALENENAELRKAVPTSSAGGAQGDYKDAFRQGVRAYDLKDWKGSAQYMRDAIRFQSSVKDPVKRLPIYGLRIENYAPQSYLGRRCSR
jgi:energy-coupling factor transporter ATP-binding protein EcfA2